MKKVPLYSYSYYNITDLATVKDSNAELKMETETGNGNGRQSARGLVYTICS